MPVLLGYRYTLNQSGTGFYVEPNAGYSFGGSTIGGYNEYGALLNDGNGDWLYEKVAGPTGGVYKPKFSTKMKTKKLGALLGVCALAALMAFCFVQAEPEIHLIPKGYKGSVIITFEDSTGVDGTYDKDKRVYRIPENGILRTKFKERSKGFIADKDLLFYYADDNEKHPLKVIHEIQNHKIDETDTNIYIFRFQNSYKMISFIVGTLNEREKYYQELRSRLDSLFPPQIVK